MTLKINFSIKFLLVSLFITIISIGFYSCKKNQESEGNSDKIQTAKSWFKSQKDMGFSPKWDQATVKNDGTNIYVVVPSNYSINPIGTNIIKSYLVVEASQNQSLSGKIIEYINTTVEESISRSLFGYVFGAKSEVPILKGDVLVFDLKHTFLEGFKFNGNQPPNKLAAFKDKKSSLGSGGTGVGGKQMSLDNEQADCSNWFWVVYDINTGEILSSTYLYTICTGTGEGSGGGGGASTSSTITISQVDLDSALLIADNTPKIKDIQKYKECFSDGKQVQSYTITIYVDQPVPNSNDQWVLLPPNFHLTNPSEAGIMVKTQNLDLDVGHTFVCYEKNNIDGTNVRQTVGFYPDPEGSHTSSKGVIKDNSNHTYDVSYKITVTESQFNASLSKLTSDFNNAQYNLRTYNCTDAALSWMNAAGANISSVPRGLYNNTPGDLGQALRSKPTANKNGGNAAAGKGPCN